MQQMIEETNAKNKENEMQLLCFKFVYLKTIINQVEGKCKLKYT
jgi:hypothetical protein